MKPRRTSFAAPFVMVVAAGCGGASREPIHANPPGSNPPEPRMSADQCRAQSDGAPCDGDFTSCSTQSENGCGLQGFECIKADDGKQTWHAYFNTCTPPPAQEPTPGMQPATQPKT